MSRSARSPLAVMSPFSSLLALACAVIATSASYLSRSNPQCSAVELGLIQEKIYPIYLPESFISSPGSILSYPDYCAARGLFLQGTDVAVCNVESYGPAPELIPDDPYDPLSPVRVVCKPELYLSNWCPLGLKANAIQYCSGSPYIGRDGAPEKKDEGKKVDVANSHQ